MRGRAIMMVCDLWQPASATAKLDRAPAAFRSWTRRPLALIPIIGDDLDVSVAAVVHTSRASAMRF